MNLKHQLVIEDCCDHCKHDSEDILHAIWGCPLLSPIWNHQSYWNFRDTKVFMSFKELVEFFIDEDKDLALFATIVWYI